MLVCAVLVPAAALFFSLRQDAQYAASANVLLSRQNLGAMLEGTTDTSLFANDERFAATQAELAHTPDVARQALSIARVSALTPDELLQESSVTTKGTTDILEFRVTDGDPDRAELLATSFARAFVSYRSRLDTQALAKARSEVTSTLDRLKAEGRESSNLFTSLEEKEQQLQTLQTLQTSQVYVTRRADDAVQVAPKPARNAVLGLALGLVLGVGLAFAFDALDTRVRSATEIGEKLGLPLLARVPPPPKGFARENKLVMLQQPTGTNAEAFRMLRTNLEFAALEGDDMRVLLVTSAVEEEGKSTTAANLALAEARAGRKVVLVDLDLRRPYIDRFFSLLHAEGITDVALGNIALEDALHRIDLAVGSPAGRLRVVTAESNGHGERGSLDVITAGPLPPDPGEFVGTKRLAEILTRLRQRYQLVIVDTPPMLRVGDTMALSPQVDGILVVTRLNVVRRQMLGELRRILDSAPVPKLGFVVTGSGGGETAGYGYGYGYPYGGYGYGDPEKMDQERAAARSGDAAKEADRA